MAAKQHAAQARRCFYEVLGLARTATQDEIKTAYRKQALTWHPDKNADNLEEATERFKEISNAYTTLSDPQEKAWYDQHRDQILKGGHENHEPDEDEDAMDLFQYFTSSAFDGYDDSDDGFFQVYQGVFVEIDAAEEAAEATDVYHEDAPKFGSSEAPWPQVQAFYNYWESFSTVKGFYSSDVYNPQDGPSRQHRRAMEKVNAKNRSKAKKAFNETVRSLVAWVKKRDPRVTKRQKQLEEEKREKEARAAAHKKEMAAKLAKLREEHVHEFHVDDRLDDEYATMERKTPADQEELYCAACKKIFKSEKQWDSHQRSKKHIDNVRILREQLLEEELEEELEELELTDDNRDHEEADDVESMQQDGGDVMPNENENENNSEDDEDEENSDFHVLKSISKAKEKRKKKMEKKKQKMGFFETPEQRNDDDDDDGETGVAEGISNMAEIDTHEDIPAINKDDDNEHLVTDNTPSAKAQKKKKKKEKQHESAVLSCSVCGDVFVSRNQMFKHLDLTGHAVAPTDIPNRKGRKG